MKKWLFLLLFFWISFFAPLANDLTRLVFLAALLLTLCIQCLLNKDVRLQVFSRSELPLLILLLAILAGLFFAYKSPIDYKGYLLFILPAIIVYFFAKVNFREDYLRIAAKIIYTMAFLVVACGLIEFAARQSPVKACTGNSIYYQAFLGSRMMSFHQHPAPLGTYLVAVFPLFFVLIKRDSRFTAKLFWGIFALVILLGIIFTFSRGVFLGLLAELCIILALLGGQRYRKAILISVFSGVVIISVATLLAQGGLGFFSRLGPEGLSYSGTYTNKFDRFLAAIQILKDHPFFGLGFGNFRTFFDAYLPHLANTCNYDGKVADCMYLTILAEFGIVGGFGFMVFLVSVVKKALSSIKKSVPNNTRIITISFFSGIMGVLVSFFTYDGLYWSAPGYLFWTYAGVLSGLNEKNEK